MNMIKKEKRMYEKPTWGVIEMRQRLQLLQVSGGVDATMNGTWDEEII